MKKTATTCYPISSDRQRDKLISTPILRTMLAVSMLFAASSFGYGATNYYVWKDNPSPQTPYTNWTMAATNIQLAVDLTIDGDTVYVTNGVYDTGGALTPAVAILTNRVYITKNITLTSMNGPAYTTIKGNPDPGAVGGFGAAAVRCVFLTNGASLIGFTVTNGYTSSLSSGDAIYRTRAGGGVILYANSVVSNCVISGNKAHIHGGGVDFLFGGTMNNCTISGNVGGSDGGGGVWIYGNGIVMNYCTISKNSAPAGAGVVMVTAGTLNHCTISENTATNGFAGGVYMSRGYMALNYCMIMSNIASGNGGGVYIDHYAGSIDGDVLNNCLIVGNSSTNANGGGVYFGMGGWMTNCTISGNTAAGLGGGVYLDGTGTVVNCVIWGNSGSSSNVDMSGSPAVVVNYTCSGPVQSGIGNIGANPLFVDTNSGNYRLAANSPCINKGTNQSWMTSGYDLDWRTRIRYGTVDMGAYERIHEGTTYRFY